MAAGLIAGAIGTTLAILLSLPLRSPDDVFFNAATVTAGGLVAAAGAGVAWSRLRARSNARRNFAIGVGVVFLVVAVGALGGEALFERTAAYTIPIAGVIFGTIAVTTPALARRRLPAWAGPAALVPVVALGAVFAESGDEDATPLTLPAAASTVSASGSAGAPRPGETGTVTGVAPIAFRTPADVGGVKFVVGEGSQTQFTVREQLSNVPLPNDATMRNSALAGEVHLDGRPSTIEIDLTKFSSDQPRRDSFIREMWSRQPIARVTIDNIGALPEQYSAGEVVRQRVTGRLSILGFEAPIAFDVEARLEEGTLSVLGTTKFRWADFNLRPPNTATVRVEDEVSTQILIVARAGSG
jgi:hypothetical protein